MKGWTAPIIFTHVVDRAVADRTVEDRVVLGLHERRADDGVLLVDVGDDLVDLVGRVTKLVERHRHGLVDDRDLAAADELLRLDEREVGLDPGGVAIHHEADRPGGSEDGRLRVPVARHLALVERVVPGLTRRGEEIVRNDVRVLDVPDGRSMLGDDAEHRAGVGLIAGMRAHPRGDLGRLLIRATRHERRDRGSVGAAFV
jgi:hypothetical protein